MLVVEGLTCRFGTRTAVDNVSFSITPGGFVGVIGRSGAGKSTLLRMINRLAEPTSGRIVSGRSGRGNRCGDGPLTPWFVVLRCDIRRRLRHFKHRKLKDSCPDSG